MNPLTHCEGTIALEETRLSPAFTAGFNSTVTITFDYPLGLRAGNPQTRNLDIVDCRQQIGHAESSIINYFYAHSREISCDTIIEVSRTLEHKTQQVSVGGGINGIQITHNSIGCLLYTSP